MTAAEEYGTGVPAIIDTAIRAAEPKIVKAPVEDEDDGTRAVVYALPDGGKVQTVDVEALVAQYRDRPRRKKGTYAAHDPASLVKYLEKHALPQTEVWADVLSARITAVINAHHGQTGDGVEDYAGWSDHRAVYAVSYTTAWQAWAAQDGKLLDQMTFAELIEDRAIDILTPSAADMLELVQTFQTTTNVEFESSQRLSSGEAQLTYKEIQQASAGRTKQMEIPTAFTLILKPFEGAAAQHVTARLRYRIVDKRLKLGFRLERPEDIVREAFESVISQVESQITWPVFRGTSS